MIAPTVNRFLPAFREIWPFLVSLAAGGGVYLVARGPLGWLGVGWADWLAPALAVASALALGVLHKRSTHWLLPTWGLTSQLSSPSDLAGELRRSLSLIADVEPLVASELGKLYSAQIADRLVLLVSEEAGEAFRPAGWRGYKQQLAPNPLFQHNSRLVR